VQAAEEFEKGVLKMGRKNFVNHTELPYHVTGRVHNREEWFVKDMDAAWEILTRNLHFAHLAFGVRIHAFVMMSNHYHLIVSSPNGNLSAAMSYFGRQTAREMTAISHRINQTFGNRFHRSLLHSPLYFLHAYKYVYRNPVSAGLCKKVEDWPYSTLPALLGESPVHVPVLDDERWGTIDEREWNLMWLNCTPSDEDMSAVRKALRRSTFKLPKSASRDGKLENETL
jgi:REP element-mobilizing transposase RayT